MKILYKIEFLFYFYFGKFVTKNRAFENNTIFLQQFFRFRGEGEFPHSTMATPLIYTIYLDNILHLKEENCIHIHHMHYKHRT